MVKEWERERMKKNLTTYSGGDPLQSVVIYIKKREAIVYISIIFSLNNLLALSWVSCVVEKREEKRKYTLWWESEKKSGSPKQLTTREYCSLCFIVNVSCVQFLSPQIKKNVNEEPTRCFYDKTRLLPNFSLCLFLRLM